MTLFDKISSLCDERKMPMRQLEKDAGLSPRTIQHWDTSKPSGDKIVRVAIALDVPVEELLAVYDTSGEMQRISNILKVQKSVATMELSEREKSLLFYFRLLNKEGEDFILTSIETLAENEKFKRYKKDTSSKAV